MKKKLLTTLSVVLILGLAALGILAYLTDQDSDVNVMTLGNVDIEQNEYQRDTNDDGTYVIKESFNSYPDTYKLEVFDQDKPLLPIVGDPSLPDTNPGYAGWDNMSVLMNQVDSYGSMQVFAGKNAQDKFVVVENTGKTDAYVRTLVAIEVGSTNGSLIGTSYHKNWTQNEIGKVEIDGNDYNVFEYVYKGADGVRHDGGILPAGDTAYPNLSQVYIKSAATNEDCAAIDGNGNGKLDILVLSQAVQADGFESAQIALDTAFGKASEKANDWFKSVLQAPASVENSSQLATALEEGKSVELKDDIELTDSIEISSGNVTVALNGNTLDLGNDGIEISGNAVLDIVGDGTGNSKIETDGYSNPIDATGYSTVNITDVTIDLSNKAGDVGVAVSDNAVINMTSGKIIDNSTEDGCPVMINENAHFIMNGGEIEVSGLVAILLGANADSAVVDLIGGKISVPNGYAILALAGNIDPVNSVVNIGQNFVIDCPDDQLCLSQVNGLTVNDNRINK